MKCSARSRTTRYNRIDSHFTEDDTAVIEAGREELAMMKNAVGRPMEILLVEDSLTSGTFTIGALRQGQFQHRCTWLRDGEQALEFLYQRGMFARAPQPDLILLDLGLPKIDGLQVLSEVKSIERLKSIPVVIMTASTDPAERERAEQLHVASYVAKPVNLEKFLALVKELKVYWQSDLLLPETHESATFAGS
jgi:chemotaxis family two-component system response regulator Rcp1